MNHENIEIFNGIKPESKGSFRFGLNLNPSTFRLFYFSITILFVYLADAIMSYATPGFLEDHLTSTALMGIVFATSSMVGFLVDFLLGEMFEGKSYRFFLKWGIITAVGFPLGYILLPTNIGTLILGLAIWGVYYELVSFANSQYISDKTAKNEHEVAWGIVYFFRAASLTFGPIIAAALLDISYEVTFIAAIFFLAIAAVLFIFNKDKRSDKPVHIQENVQHISTFTELKIWSIFTKRIWLLLLFCFGIVFLDAAFWSIGTLLSEEMHSVMGGVPGMLLVIYSLPMFFMGFFAKRAATPYGKKKAAFITALVGSIFLMLVGFTNDYYLVMLFVFIFACFFAVAGPEIKGVFADYDARMNRSRNSLIGLESGIYSAGYVVGPIVCGFLADRFGIQQTFSILGIGMIIIILLCLVFVPRKIKMPKSELELLEMN